MESAILTRRAPGTTGQARLLRVPRGRVPRGGWPRVALAVLCLGALLGYLAFPTYPTYDSFYALLWGRDVLHLHLPDFRVYRGPTEHPLAIAFGALCSIFGQAGARLVVLGSISSFVAAVAGLYRLGRLCFGPVVGVIAALLLLSRFFVESLAAEGYLDITYVALIVWAIVLEVERPRRGRPVYLMLAAAGLLRPDAWVLSGAYWLWMYRRPRTPGTTGTPQSPPTPGTTGTLRSPRTAGTTGTPQTSRTAGTPRTLGPLGPPETPETPERPPLNSWLAQLPLVALAPVVWIATDWIVTGEPLYSLTATAGLAQELERTQGFSAVLGSAWTFSERIDKLPVVLGALAGVPLAIWMAPRRTLVPLASMLLLYGVFLLEGAGGASVIDRYLLGGATVLLLFCAVFVGGWSMLERGTLLRRTWIAGAALLVLFGVFSAATTLNLSSLRTTLADHEDFHQGLAATLAAPAVKRELGRCPLLSLPNNKLIPDARWILHSTGQHDIVARSQARADVAKGSHALSDRIKAGSVAVYPLGSAVFVEAIVDVGDDPRDEVPLPGFRLIYTGRYFAVYGNC